MKRTVLTNLILLLPLLLMGQEEMYSIEKTKFSSKNYNEYSPVFYNDGLVFSTNKQKGIFSYSSPESGGLYSIYKADTIGSVGKHKAKFFSKELNTRMNDGPVTFNATQDTVYFTRNRLVDGKINELSSPWNKLGIFSANLVNGKWVNIKEFRYNNEWYNITTPCLSPDGKRLYFASDMPNGYGGSDLYYCVWKNGYWDNPINMGPVINTEKNEAYPFINPSGEFFFSSDGHPGMGGKDIFYSRYENNAWLQPVPLSPPINSEFEDFGFISDTLMNSGYFSSNRDKSIDIYHFITEYPQIFYVNYQHEPNYCYIFKEPGLIEVDTLTLEFKWNFGGGKMESGAKVSHCFPGPGEYRAELNVIERVTGRVFFKIFDYKLKITEPVQAYISSPDLIIKDKEIEFSAVKSNLPGYTITDYIWNFDDGTHSHGKIQSHTFTEEGDFDVSLFLNIRSDSTGKASKTSISKKIRVVNNMLEKEYFLADAGRQNIQYTNVEDAEETEITALYSAPKDIVKDAVFCLELISSKEKLKSSSSVFNKLPDKYLVKEWYNEQDEVYNYTVEQQLNLMSLYPAFKELRNLGFKSVEAKAFVLKDPAEKELFNLLRTYDTSTDNYFDPYDRLSTNAYIMLDQIVKFFNTYPTIKLEVGYHTDNMGYASRNLSLSNRRAKILGDYLINRGIESSRISHRGYGESKPIAPNTYELDRKQNRRVEFIIVK